MAERHAARLGCEHPGGKAFVHTVDRLVDESGHQPELGPLRDDGDRVEHRPPGFAQARRPGEHRLADGVGNALLGCGERLGHEEGIACGPVPELLGIDAVGLREPSDGGGRERAELDPVDAGTRRELAEHGAQGVLAVHAVMAVARDDDRGDRLDAPHQQPQRIERRLVGPVDVLEYEHAWPARPQLPAQGRRNLVGHDAAGDDFLELAARVLGDREQRPQGTRGEQRVATAPQHACPVAHIRPELPEQRALADACIAADEHEAAGRASHDRVQASRQRGALPVTLQELARRVRCPGRRRQHHAAIVLAPEPAKQGRRPIILNSSVVGEPRGCCGRPPVDGRGQPPLNGRTSGFMLANRPDGFGYQSHTCNVTRSGCQNPNAAPVPGAVFAHAACDGAGTNVPST